MLVLADDEMLHYGVLGMKWGVNKETGEVKAYPYLNILYGDVEVTPI